MTTQDSVQRFLKTVENYAKYRPTYPQALVDVLVIIKLHYTTIIWFITVSWVKCHTPSSRNFVR
jgi:hypothetical protein